MRLEEMLDLQLKAFSPKPIRYTANLAHLYADYLEMIASLRNGDLVTAADLINRYKTEDGSVPQVSQVYAGPLRGETETAAEKEDSYDAWAAQVFFQVAERSRLFGTDYPFEHGIDSIRLKERLSTRQHIYLMLVLCSNLHFVPLLQQVLTKDFEALSKEALRSLLPATAEVKGFGKNSDYSGTAEEKIWQLAMDMNVEINEKQVKKVLGNQERGLDVVGWIPFRDQYANFISMLMQCACGKDWFAKLNETRRYERGYLVFEGIKPIHILSVPRCLHYRGDIYQSDEVHDVLLMERSRLMELIKSEEFFSKSDSKKIVERLVSFEEDVV